MTKDLKDEIEDTKVNQTVGMQRITGDLKKEIRSVNKNQTKDMQGMTNDFKNEIESEIKDLETIINALSQSAPGVKPTQGGGG